MIVTIAGSRIIGRPLVMIVAVVVAMIVSAHRMMIIGAILGAGRHGAEPGQCECGQGKQGRFPEVLSHGVPSIRIKRDAMAAAGRGQVPGRLQVLSVLAYAADAKLWQALGDATCTLTRYWSAALRSCFS